LSTPVRYDKSNKSERGGAHVANTGTQEGGLPRPVFVFNKNDTKPYSRARQPDKFAKSVYILSTPFEYDINNKLKRGTGAHVIDAGQKEGGLPLPASIL